MARLPIALTPDSTANAGLDLKAFKLILPYMWPRDDPRLRVRLVLSVSLLGLTALLNALVPILLAIAVDSLTEPKNGLVVVPLALLFSYGVMHWLSKAMGELRWVLYGPIEQRIQRSVGLAVFRHVHDLSLRFHLGRRTGGLSRIMDNGMRGVRELLFHAVFMVLPLLAEVIFICAVMLGRYEAGFTAIMLVTLSLFTVALLIGSEWLRHHQRRAVRKAAEAHGKAIDSMINYETVKYFGNENYDALRYDDALREVERLAVHSLTWRSLTGVIQVSIIGLGMTAMILLAGTRVSDGAMSVGDFVLVNAYLLQLFRPMERIAHMYRNIKQELVNVEQMLVLLDVEAEVLDDPNAVSLPPGPGQITFERVAFAYDQRRSILEDVSFVVAPGKTVAIVGPTGAGKSTIGRLLFRFYDTQAGQILVDGTDVKTLTQSSLRACIAVVPQDTVLFNESIFYNIAFGRPNAERQEVEEVARMAEIHDFVVNLPDGYDTIVGERGLKLSGGEKQRVAIARAILKHPRILLFDEATSALDSQTERSIQANLHKVSRGITTVTIAHRLSTINHADEILFLEHGKVVERGNHAQLLANGAYYAALWASQLDHRQAAE